MNITEAQELPGQNKCPRFPHRRLMGKVSRAPRAGNELKQ